MWLVEQGSAIIKVKYHTSLNYNCAMGSRLPAKALLANSSSKYTQHLHTYIQAHSLMGDGAAAVHEVRQE
jgi:hypothetical protein